MVFNELGYLNIHTIYREYILLYTTIYTQKIVKWLGLLGLNNNIQE